MKSWRGRQQEGPAGPLAWLDTSAGDAQPGFLARRLRALRQVGQRQAAQKDAGNPVVQAKLSGYLGRRGE